MRAEGEIMKTVGVLVTVLILVGCALPAGAQTVVVGAQTVVTTPSRYSGEVWTWDSGRSIVTLYDAGRQFRVQVTPDQIARLNHHGFATVTGVLLGPEPIDTVLLPAQPMVAQPNGAAITSEVTGQIASIEGNGAAVVESARGPFRVWLADNAQSRFAVGRPVAMQISVQPVRMVAVSGAGGLASGPTIAAPAPVQGDQAVVVGRILSVSPTGTLAIESPRGPISVWVPNAASFKTGDFVQVQTVVRAI
jgi:hypothetical protein